MKFNNVSTHLNKLEKGESKQNTHKNKSKIPNKIKERKGWWEEINEIVKQNKTDEKHKEGPER